MAVPGFKWVRSNGYEVPLRVTNIPAAIGETFTTGEALTTNASGQLTKAGATSAIIGFANQTKTTTASDNTLEFIEARADDVFSAPYTGTPAAGFVLGANAVTLAADGLSANAATVAGGALTIRIINTNTGRVHVSVKNRLLT